VERCKFIKVVFIFILFRESLYMVWKLINIYRFILGSTVSLLEVVFTYYYYFGNHWILKKSVNVFHFGKHCVFWKVVNVYHQILGSPVYLCEFVFNCRKPPPSFPLIKEKWHLPPHSSSLPMGEQNVKTEDRGVSKFKLRREE